MDSLKEVTMADIVRPLIMQDVGETRTNLIPNVNVKNFVGVIVCQKNVSCELKKDAPASHMRPLLINPSVMPSTSFGLIRALN